MKKFPDPGRLPINAAAPSSEKRQSSATTVPHHLPNSMLKSPRQLPLAQSRKLCLASSLLITTFYEQHPLKRL